MKYMAGKYDTLLILLFFYDIMSIIHRYIDDIFLTSNQSLHAINQILDEANNSHPNIKLVRQVGTKVSFLDVLIENQDGILATSVFHKEAAEPYIVPFHSDHPRHIFANITDNALLRAVRYSSKLPTFQQEQRLLKLMLLYNGFVLSNRFLSLHTSLYFLFVIAIHHDTSTVASQNFSNLISIHQHSFYH